MILDLSDLKRNLNKRLLGIDVGEKTLGLATCDVLWTIASPYKTIKRTRLQDDVQSLLNVIKEEQIAALVFGYPINMNGSIGPSCERVLKLTEQFESIPCFLWDERLSTMVVQRTLLQADVSRKKRAQNVDKLAASFILQGVLDFSRFN